VGGCGAGTLRRSERAIKEVSVKTTCPCPCGALIRGEDEDDLVEKTFAHLREKHPHIADDYEREHILAISY
jgi:hypothetical protein